MGLVLVLGCVGCIGFIGGRILHEEMAPSTGKSLRAMNDVMN
jgi:hypothetical protein